jgi:hypothetical protein
MEFVHTGNEEIYENVMARLKKSKSDLGLLLYMSMLYLMYLKLEVHLKQYYKMSLILIVDQWILFEAIELC